MTPPPEYPIKVRASEQPFAACDNRHAPTNLPRYKYKGRTLCEACLETEMGVTIDEIDYRDEDAQDSRPTQTRSCFSVSCDMAAVGCDKTFCYKLLSDEDQLLARAIRTLWKAGGWSRADLALLFCNQHDARSYGFIKTVIEEVD